MLRCHRLLPLTFCTVLTGGFATGSLAQKQQKVAPKPDFAKLRIAYDYNAKTPLQVQEKPKADPDAYVAHLTLKGANGETVPGGFMRPKKPGVYPCVLLLHGWTSDKETMLNGFGKPLVKAGYAVLALDAPRHGERKIPNHNLELLNDFPLAMREGNRDYRRALDYLATRKDINKKRIGLLGYSMGSMMGAILSSVDKRIQACALCVGGDVTLPYAQNMPPEARSAVYSIAPSLFASHIAPCPLYMINGKQDTTVNAQATKLLFDAAKKPKEIVWVNAGHILPAEYAARPVKWLITKLK